jgi:hypothetical protein
LNHIIGFHSEWNLGSPGGWDYQRINQEIGKIVWQKLYKNLDIDVELDFDHPRLFPLKGFVDMLINAHQEREGSNHGFIAVVAEEETLDDVVENKNLAKYLAGFDGISSALMAPHELEKQNGRVCWQGQSISIIFMDFNTDILLQLHRKYNLAPLLQAVQEGRVINPRGTEPINSKSIFEVITKPKNINRFNEETIRRTPWTRQFYPRQTQGPKGEKISDLIEWTRANWDNLVLKPERGYSGIGVSVGGIHHNRDEIIESSLKESNYIVQEKIPLNLWTENMPEFDLTERKIINFQYQTDFRCLFGKNGLFGFLGRYGGVPTNVGSGGGVQPLAVLQSNMSIDEATERINNAILAMDYDVALAIQEEQKKMAINNRFTYLLGPIKIALRPRLITTEQIEALKTYCSNIWSDCLILEKMWLADDLNILLNIEPEELEIIRSQPWGGTPAIFASDGLFSFGAHLK